MTQRLRIRTYLLVLIVSFGALVLFPSTSARGSEPRQPGIGSSLKAWRDAFHADLTRGPLCRHKNSCFGTTVHNTDSGHTFEFTQVGIVSGRVLLYQWNFPSGTKLKNVERELIRTLPRDISRLRLVVDYVGGSCGLINVTSHILGKVLGTAKIGDPMGTIGVQLQNTNTDGLSNYNPNNIQTVIVAVAAVNPLQDCGIQAQRRR